MFRYFVPLLEPALCFWGSVACVWVRLYEDLKQDEQLPSETAKVYEQQGSIVPDHQSGGITPGTIPNDGNGEGLQSPVIIRIKLEDLGSCHGRLTLKRMLKRYRPARHFCQTVDHFKKNDSSTTICVDVSPVLSLLLFHLPSVRLIYRNIVLGILL